MLSAHPAQQAFTRGGRPRHTGKTARGSRPKHTGKAERVRPRHTGKTARGRRSDAPPLGDSNDACKDNIAL